MDKVTAFTNSVPQLEAATSSTVLPSAEICTFTAELLSLQTVSTIYRCSLSVYRMIDSLGANGNENRPDWLLSSGYTLRHGMIPDTTMSETVKMNLEIFMVFLLLSDGVSYRKTNP
jgi:hypothetical protein